MSHLLHGATPGAQLLAISGPLSGRRFELREGGLGIGRHPGNEVQVPDMTSSRRHCRVRQLAGRLLVRDLTSRCGTFVNGLPVEERELTAGDVITVGASQFLVVAAGGVQPERGPDASGEERTAVRFEEEAGETGPPAPAGLTAETTVHLALTEAQERQHRRLLAALPPGSRDAQDLRILLELGSGLHLFQASEPLVYRLLELVLQAVPAERAAFLLLDARTGEFATAYALDRRRGSTTTFPVSRTVAERVVRDGTALLANDLLVGDLAGAESVQAARLRSLLAAPLAGRDGTIGLIYLDSSDPLARLDDRHLQLLSAMAGIAAVALANVRRLEGLQAENRRLAEGLRSDLIGESASMREVQRLIARVAPGDSTVLIRGESGTGKEVVARALHERSPRSAKPFVAINCATLSETLLESDLFGHEKGSFTGAVARKTGKFEVADTGTLFLDELGEMPVSLQAKLLRALETREFERLGGTRPIKVDVRVIAATNRNLEQAIRDGSFRADLYYRLNVISLHIPPLRDRRDDIPLLANHFAASLCRKLARPFAGFSPAARACLLRHDWPGNVRELANAVERALTLGEDEIIWPEDLPENLLERPPAASAPPTRYHEALNEQKRQLILGAIEQAGGRITGAADSLGLHPNYLHRLIRNLDLRQFLKGD